jgi:hypothetical protein
MATPVTDTHTHTPCTPLIDPVGSLQTHLQSEKEDNQLKVRQAGVLEHISTHS